MPYIEPEYRPRYDTEINSLAEKLDTAPLGHVNYVISRLIWKLFKYHVSYTCGNNLLGVLKCVSEEFYRRKLAPYEDSKIIENGDVDY